MGGCCTTKKFSNFEKYISAKITEAIDKNAVDKIREMILKYMTSPPNKEPLININNPIIKIYSHDMNPLGYALFLGFTETFSVILELGKAKLSAMNKLYANLGKRPIDVICEQGHRQLLEFYLPFYLAKNDEIEDSDEESISLSLSRSKNTKSHINEKSKSLLPTETISPLHKACEKARVNIVQFVWDYFKKKTVPNEFDVHYQDEYSGNNSALVACKTGSLELIKFLHEQCKVDFHIFNKRKESAIQILAVWSKKKKQKKFKECFKYLIETVGVNYTYEFEETLLILDDKSIIMYLEEKLKLDGISVSKSRVDDKYSISNNRVPAVIDPALEAKLSKIRGNKFNFKELFKEELEESKVDISSISDKSVQSVSNITFIAGK